MIKRRKGTQSAPFEVSDPTGEEEDGSSLLHQGSHDQEGNPPKFESTLETKKPITTNTCSRYWWDKLKGIGRLCTLWGNKLPPSTPKNFPNHSADDLKERPYRIVTVGKPQRFYFCNNFVKTSKYEIWNFVPKFLFEEFDPRTKLANIYFLIISCLQCVPVISNTSGVPTTLIPLSIVVFVDAVFQVLEDIARHRADEEANASLSRKFDHTSKQFVSVEWRNLSVGDIIQITSREFVPADVLILGVAERTMLNPRGICYVETKSLDGETNLKLRNAVSSTYTHMGSSSESIARFVSTLHGHVEMEHPNKLIEMFSGVCDFATYGRENIQSKNVLLRGSVLRNTEFVVGIVLNTGHDTKIMMSSASTPTKTSTLETKAAIQIKRIITLLLFVCFIGASGQAVWNNDLSVKVQDQWYLRWDPDEGAVWINQFFYFFLLHATFIPVSLYVSMSVVRFFQSKFMNADLAMYDEASDSPLQVRTMTLNEELGQISHIFTDKTGTLTCNVMSFRKVSIGGISYGEGITEIGKVAWKLRGKLVPTEILEYEKLAKDNTAPHVSFYCPKYKNMMENDNAAKIRNSFFFKVLATCHDIIPEHTKTGMALSASNPDDEATVAAAKYFGFEFIDRQDKIIDIKNHTTNKVERMELLETLEFTSRRKRMSVIVRDLATGDIILMMKGADTAILERLANPLSSSINKSSRSNKNTDLDSTLKLFGDQRVILDNTMCHLCEYGIEGLRCLLVSCKLLQEEIFLQWHEKYKCATTNISTVDMMKRGEPNDIDDLQNEIERDMILLGGTAIEDRLQDGVPESIATLAAAGIKIWMLTGDKEETAINIAIACNLLQPKEYMRHVIINTHTCRTLSSVVQLFESEITLFDSDIAAGNNQARALVIDGTVIVDVMGDEAAKTILLEFGKRCAAVVACRMSPDQKKEIITLIKNGIAGARTLAVGDGANDVAMIQAAHVGVGVKGAEGLQAVNSADYAIAKFRHLTPLMLKHGRSNYMRLSSLVIYIFYKNLLMSFCQFWFAFINGFSGQKYYTEGGIQLFNTVFTSIPILVLGVLDRDLAYNTVSKYPRIYQDCVSNLHFGDKRFWLWIINGLLESALCTFLPLYLFQNYDQDRGASATLWESGASCFTAVVVICNLKILVLQHGATWFSVITMILSILSWGVVASLINEIVEVDYNWCDVWYQSVQSHTFWMVLIVIASLALVKDSFACQIERSFFIHNGLVLQEVESSEDRNSH